MESQIQTYVCITIHNHKVNGKIKLSEAPVKYRSDQLTQIEF